MRKIPALVKARPLIAACVVLLSTVPTLASQGDEDPCSEAIKQKIFSEIQVLLPSANAGDPTAQFEVGNLYSRTCIKRKGTLEYDRDSASVWWLKAAEAGLAEAQFSVAMYYEYVAQRDNHTSESEAHKKAFNWFEKAAKNNHEAAQDFLALNYLYGKGVKQDVIKYLSIIKEAGKRDPLGYLKNLHEFFKNINFPEYRNYELSLALGIYYSKMKNENQDYYNLRLNMSQESQVAARNLAALGLDAIMKRVDLEIKDMSNPAEIALTKTLSCQVAETTKINNRSVNPTSQTCVFRLRKISNGISFSMPLVGQTGRCEMSYLFFGSEERRTGNWQVQNFVLNPRVTRFGTSGYQTSSFGLFSDESEVQLDHAINAENDGRLSAKTTLNLNKETLGVRYLHLFESVSARGVSQVQRTMNGQCKIIPN